MNDEIWKRLNKQIEDFSGWQAGEYVPVYVVKHPRAYIGRVESLTDSDKQFLRDCGIKP